MSFGVCHIRVYVVRVNVVRVTVSVPITCFVNNVCVVDITIDVNNDMLWT